MKYKGFTILSFAFILLLKCQSEDITGKIVIEYDNNWTAIITHNKSVSSVSSTGRQEYAYKNPDSLAVTASKQDTSANKLTVYIYEDNRITAAESTRDPQGSVTVQYEFPY